MDGSLVGVGVGVVTGVGLATVIWPREDQREEDNGVVARERHGVVKGFLIAFAALMVLAYWMQVGAVSADRDMCERIDTLRYEFYVDREVAVENLIAQAQASEHRGEKVSLWKRVGEIRRSLGRLRASTEPFRELDGAYPADLDCVLAVPNPAPVSWFE